ncbi:MAG: DNA methyltransferase [Planctomycetota bacterium]
MIIRDTAARKLYEPAQVRNAIIHGDALKVLPKIETGVYDMVFVDPPYFLQLPKRDLRRWNVKTVVEGVEDAWDRFESFEAYDAFIERLFAEVRRVMKPAATVWVISTYHSVFRIGRILQDLGYWILNDVIWLKTNPMPNWLGVRFTNATETLIWALRDKTAKGYTFHKDAAKRFGVGKVGANVWTMPICTGRQRLKKKDGAKVHATQKPEELLRRILLTTTDEGDLVLDPVAGTGTTGAVAKALGREYTLVEKSRAYVQAAQARLRHKT